MRVEGRARGKQGLLLFVLVLAVSGFIALTLANRAGADETLVGTAIVEVISEPPICNGGRVRFTGVPSGELTLGDCQPGQPIPSRRLSGTNLGSGPQESKLTFIDQSILDLGYRLAEIRCDDGNSATRSFGDLDSSKATFGIDGNETVTCKFLLALSTCTCPKAGKWKVNNHVGSMACSGTFSMTTPLKQHSTTGTIEPRDDCATLIAEGMSQDEATITFRRTPQCEYRGAVGGSSGPFPMTINFTLVVENEERLTGGLSSTMSQQGTTCEMNRTYELDFSAP